MVIAIFASSPDLVYSIKNYTASGMMSQEKSTTTFDTTSLVPKTPVYFLSHGGVSRALVTMYDQPLTEQPNLLEEPDHPAYRKLQEIGKEVTSIVKPKAVVIFSAHWQGQNDRVLVNTAEISDLIYE